MTTDHNADTARVLDMARHDLLTRMRDESEDRWAAGWLIDLEYTLWSEPEWQAIGYALGGWWTWPDTWVPLDRWLEMVDEHNDGEVGQ